LELQEWQVPCWFWSARSAEAQDPTPDAIAADPNLANQYGKARTYYEKYVELAGVDKEKNKKEINIQREKKRKKNEMK
jgi:hypothetical protein